jgi:hypothetical protein
VAITNGQSRETGNRGYTRQLITLLYEGLLFNVRRFQTRGKTFRFVNISGIIYHHCLNFIKYYSKRTTLLFDINLSIIHLNFSENVIWSIVYFHLYYHHSIGCKLIVNVIVSSAVSSGH